MYGLGVTTLTFTHGSAIDSISPTGGSCAGLSTTTSPRLVGQAHAVLDRRRGRDQVEVELALEPLLDDLHVQQAQEAAAKPQTFTDEGTKGYEGVGAGGLAAVVADFEHGLIGGVTKGF